MREFQKEVYDRLYQFCITHEVNPIIIDLFDIHFIPEINRLVATRLEEKEARQYFPIGMSMKSFLDAINEEIAIDVTGDFDSLTGKLPGMQLTLGIPDFSDN